MADITLSPLPYNGGTFQFGANVYHYCQLSSGKFLHVAAQTNPGYIYAWTTTMLNMKTGNFSSAAGPMRAILSGTSVPTTFASMRVFKLSPSRALLVVTGTGAASPRKLYVLELGAGDDIVVKNATLTNGVISNNESSLTISRVAYSMPTSVSATGSHWQGFFVRENTVYFTDRGMASGELSITLRKIVYSPEADTLTVSTIATYGTGTSFGTHSFTRCSIQDIPGSTTKLFTVRAHLTASSNVASMQTSRIVYAALISATDEATQLTGTLPSNLQALVPLSETTILGLPDSKSYFTWNGTSWTSSPASITTNGSSNIVEAIALDANYFMIISGQFSSSDIASDAFFLTARVVRYVDPTFAQCSAPTQTSDGVWIGGIAYAQADQAFVFRNESDAVYLLARTSSLASGAASVKVLYQPGA